MRYINGGEIKYDFTKPKTYIRPVFESLEDEHIRMHHIDVECGFKKSKFVPIEHVSKQRRRTFKLEEENAKLRELVRDMWTCVSEGEWDCSDCPRYARCDDGVSEFRDRARELGIEVNE